jgi:hypothetical protein
MSEDGQVGRKISSSATKSLIKIKKFLSCLTDYFNKFLIIKPCHTVFLTAVEQNQDGTIFHSDPARKLSANLYDIHHCRVYSEKLLTMD